MPCTEFVFQPSDDPSVEDPQWVLLRDPRVTVQDASAYGGGYGVVVDMRDDSFVFHDPHRSLAKAKAHALAVAATLAKGN